MQGREVIDHIKNNRKPKDGYSLIIGLSANDNLRYYASIFKRVEVLDRRRMIKDYADTSIANIMTKDLEAYKKFIIQYTDKRDLLPIISK